MIYCPICGKELKKERVSLDIAIQCVECENRHMYFFYKMPANNNDSEVTYREDYSIEDLKTDLKTESRRMFLNSQFALVARKALEIVSNQEAFNQIDSWNNINYCVKCGKSIKEFNEKKDIYHTYYFCENEHKTIFRNSLKSGDVEIYPEFTKESYLHLINAMIHPRHKRTLISTIFKLIGIQPQIDSFFEGQRKTLLKLFPFLLDIEKGTSKSYR